MTEKKLNDELEKFSYALGMSIAGNLIQSGVKTVNPEIFFEAFKDTFEGEKPKIMPDEANKILEEDPSLKKYPALQEKLQDFQERIHLE